jgi:hypothetical protein
MPILRLRGCTLPAEETSRTLRDSSKSVTTQSIRAWLAEGTYSKRVLLNLPSHGYKGGARNYYRRRREHGDRHAAANRRLFNKLIGQLYHCLQHRNTFDEARASLH